MEILTLTYNQAINILNKKLKKLLFKTIELIIKNLKHLRIQTVNEIAEEILN